MSDILVGRVILSPLSSIDSGAAVDLVAGCLAEHVVIVVLTVHLIVPVGSGQGVLAASAKHVVVAIVPDH
jgi:hypothetical protein